MKLVSSWGLRMSPADAMRLREFMSSFGLPACCPWWGPEGATIDPAGPPRLLVRESSGRGWLRSMFGGNSGTSACRSIRRD